MSHVARIEGLVIDDLDALGEAAKACGLELVPGQRTYRWFGRSVGDYPLPAGFTEADLGKCEHAIRVPGSKTAYEIGVVGRRDVNGNALPGFELLWDFWSGGYGLRDLAGRNCQNLVQQYVAAGVKKTLGRKFRNFTTTKLPNGAIALEVS